MAMMSGLAFIALLLILAGAIISLLSLHIYNKRLEKIAKGEIRDVHSKILDPGTTAGLSYKVVLIVIIIISFISIAGLTGRIDSLYNQINSMQRTQNSMESELTQIRYQLEESTKLVSSMDWNLTDEDLKNNSINVDLKVTLKSFSDDTTVTLDVNGTQIPMSKVSSGTYQKKFTANIFEDYTQLKLLITQNGITTVETPTDFPDYLFWSYLPMPSLECCFESDMKAGKLTYGGWYKLVTDYPEDIEKATVTYVSDGKDLKTIDATKEAKELSEITLEKGLDVKKDLTLRMEFLTKDGYKIEQQSVVIFEARPDLEDNDYLRIYDSNGTLVWEDPYRN